MRFIFAILATAFVTLYFSVSHVWSLALNAGPFEIPPGATISALPEILKIDIAPWRFKAYYRVFVEPTTLQTGRYRVQSGATVSQLFTEVLKHPESPEFTLTLLPGWNLWDMDAAFAKSGLLTTGEFLAMARDPVFIAELAQRFPFLSDLTSLEGYILPDSYRVRWDFGFKYALTTILTTFGSRVYEQRPSGMSDQKFRDSIILASIVEREENNDANLSLVAGIFTNRLRLGMALGADATTCYTLQISHSECTPAVVGANIFKDTPYDTRRKIGLPPTPISNPSVRTIQAVFSPQSTKDLYYLHGSNGQIYTSETLEGHVRNKRFL